jgi:hypothetical protein
MKLETPRHQPEIFKSWIELNEQNSRGRAQLIKESMELLHEIKALRVIARGRDFTEVFYSSKQWVVSCINSAVTALAKKFFKFC